MTMKDNEVAIVKGMLLRGDDQHHIAALFGVNPGRIAEISQGMNGAETTRNGKPRVLKGTDIEPVAEADLPPPGPYFLNLISAKDIILDGLEAVEEIVAQYASKHGDGARDLQRRYHSAIAERRRELWKGRR